MPAPTTTKPSKINFDWIALIKMVGFPAALIFLLLFSVGRQGCTTLLQSLLDGLKQSQGLTIAILILTNIFIPWYMSRLHERQQDQKDKEIDRVAAERSKLQEALIKRSLSHSVTKPKVEAPKKGGKS